MLVAGCGLAGLVASAAPASVQASMAQGASHPTADQIMQRWVDISSRSEKGELLTSLIAQQTAIQPAENLKSRAETLIDYEKGRTLLHMRSQRRGSTLSGFVDGRIISQDWTAFTWNSDIEATEAPVRSRANHEVDFRSRYSTRTYLGSSRVDGRRIHRVRLVAANEQQYPIERWFDANSGVLIKEFMKIAVDGIRRPIVIAFGDYRRVNGFLIPFRQVTTIGPVELELITHSVQTNVPIPLRRYYPGRKHIPGT
ncbi:MAG: hypothetical protein AAFV29_15835 [Myxococcota bacterium]